MEIVFSKEIQECLDVARLAGLRKMSRLRVDTGGEVFDVLRMWKSGFAVAVEDAPNLRGRVDVYDGANHLFQCLIVAHEESSGEMCYEFKRATPVADRAAYDYVRSAEAPAGLIERRGH